MAHELTQLPYPYDALEPHIDAKTMEIHHTKHHAAYVKNLNAVLDKYPDLASRDLSELLKDIDNLKMEEADRTTLRNNGGGHLNHSLFWQILGPEKQVDQELVAEIEKTFGSIEKFKEDFTAAASSRFGSGWAWLARDENSSLVLYSLPNQDSPVMQGHVPLIGLDVWEHAYYLKYQNRRPDYISNWWSILKLI